MSYRQPLEGTAQGLPDDYDFSDRPTRNCCGIGDLHQSEDAQVSALSDSSAVDLGREHGAAGCRLPQQHPAGRILVLAGKGHVSTRVIFRACDRRISASVGPPSQRSAHPRHSPAGADYLVLANGETCRPPGW